MSTNPLRTMGSAMRVAMLALLVFASSATAQVTQVVSLRGHLQTLRVYGTPGHPPVIVTSGDGGWMHLAPHVAAFLAVQGYFVIGFDARGYLESFTTRGTTLIPADAPQDFRTLAAVAARGSDRKPVLVGVSEGAGLSLLAATNAETRQAVGGVIALGLPDVNELGWRWKDAICYLTHATPAEPTFSTAAIASRLSPAPLAAIHATHDEFVPLPEVQRIMAAAREPKRLWIVPAADHRFSDSLPELDARLLEALAWVRQQEP
jgi:alpha-beta hydrolase superfamily lysophospholipase